MRKKHQGHVARTPGMKMLLQTVWKYNLREGIGDRERNF
jgi:hypothetical protein